MRRLGVSYTEVRNMPIMYREWFIKRFVREHEEQAAAFNRTARETNSSLERSSTIARAFTR